MFNEAEAHAAGHRYHNVICKWYGKPKPGEEEFIEEVFPGTLVSGYIITNGFRFMAFCRYFDLERFEVW